jgi:UDP-glucose:(heptosyl)LPS alpha-1,3-glucosyltransferase
MVARELHQVDDRDAAIAPDSDAEHPARASEAACDVTIVAHDIGPVGGMERQLTALILGLARLGHRVTVIARTCELSAEGEEAPDHSNVTFHRVRGPGRPVAFAYPWFMLVGGLMLRRLRRGVVQATGAIVPNRVDVIAIHYCHQVGPANPSRSTWLFRAHIRVVGRMLRLGERLCFASNRRARFVCVSDGVADDVRRHYPELSDRVLTINNGVDTDRFAPGVRAPQARALRARLGIAADRLVAAFVGGEWERKGLQPVIEALAAAPGWDVVVAGAGDEERYGALAQSLGVGAAVHWLGVSRDVQPVYELADALVFPSAYEAFSLVTLEAAASGLPILATPVSGVRELVSDGHSGFIISQDPNVIAERLSLLAADPALRESMGRAARLAGLEFSWQKMVIAHRDLYERLAAESAG